MGAEAIDDAGCRLWFIPSLFPTKHMPANPPSKASRHHRDVLLSCIPGLAATETLFDSLGDILFCVKDSGRRYVAANEAFIRSARLNSRTELLGKRAVEIFPAILAAAYEQQDDEIFSKGTSVQDRLEMIPRADGSIGWFISQKIAVRSSSGEVVALAGISRNLETRAAPNDQNAALASALNTLRQDCREPLRISDLAKKHGFSWSQFERRVRRVTGVTPRQLLTKFRIEAAAQALRASDQSLAQIASDCGFYDQAAFSHQFRSATGLTPSQYRNAFEKP